MTETNERYINREISWLQFNERVLQEAADVSVPLIERIRFLGIFSNNLDEFFKVRYATIKRIVEAGKGGKSALGGIRAKDLLDQITKIVIEHQATSLQILKSINSELEKENIFIIDETQIDESQSKFIADYFLHKVSPALVTIMISELDKFPSLADSAAYLVIKLTMSPEEQKLEERVNYALVEIPSSIDRFVILPNQGDKQFIIILDDLIRHSLKSIFSLFKYTEISAHMIKITRDAELDIDSDLSKNRL